MTGHRIELSLESDSGVTAHFVCEEPDSELCHHTCDYGCEIWNDDCIANHPHSTVKYCNCVEFVDNGGTWWEQYVGEETEPRSGSIVFEWLGEWYGWRYEEVLTPTPPTDDPWVDWGTDDNVMQQKPPWWHPLIRRWKKT